MADDGTGKRSDRDGDEPSQRPSGWRLRRLATGVLAAVACGALGAALLVGHTPAFYAGRLSQPAAALQDEPEGRRLVTKVSALHADFLRPGPWGTAISEREINAWLATDLPRNHPQLLPRRVSSPRVAIGPRRIKVGARVDAGLLHGVAWLEAEITLRGMNQLGIVVRDARLGGLPLPRGPVIREIARRIEALGMPTELRRLDGGTVLVVYIPSTHESGAVSHWLESLALEDGEVLVSGVTRAAVPAVR